MPVRAIKYNYRNITGRLASSKSEGTAEFESSLERDYLTILEFNPSVTKYEVQPVRLWYFLDGKERSYTPDVLVHFQGESGKPTPKWLVEVKYREDLRENWHWYKHRIKAAFRFAKAEGYLFHLMTEKEIRTTYLSNARFLLRYRNLPIDDPHFHVLIDKLEMLRETDPDTLLTAIYLDPWRRAQVLHVLWQCVAQGYIGTDLNIPLTMRSRIWLSQ